jgi:uncharacterized protein (TIGR00661 family)
MSARTSVESYFSAVASEYNKASNNRTWRFLRRRESDALMNVIGDVTGADVFELGCGAGYYTRLLLKAGANTVVAVDLSAAMLAELPREGVRPIQADATQVDPGRTFDVMLSAGMLEFVDDPLAALANAVRHANDGARLAILFPLNNMLGRAYQRFHRRNGMDISLFDRARIEALAQSAGWTLTRYQSAGPYSATALLTRTPRVEGPAQAALPETGAPPRPVRVLMLVNGLGLGNSTRCHAIIQRLRERSAEVCVVTSGNGKWYFEGRPDVPDLRGIEAFYYASHKGRISIPRTLLSVGAFARIARRNAKVVEEAIESFKPDVAVIDSVYTTKPFKSRGIPVAALNNADVVHTSYHRFRDKPSSIRMQFYAIEEMDYLFHRNRVDVVLSPSLDQSLPEVGHNIKRIGPIVRRGYESRPAEGPVRRVLVMLSGSRFGSKVSLSDQRHPFHIDIVGREAPTGVDLPPNVVFHGRVKDNTEIVRHADLVLVNGGFSAVSEAFALRKPMVVLPIPNHAEQWVNARTIQDLGVGFMAHEDDIEGAMVKATREIDRLRAAYDRLPPIRDGAGDAAELIIAEASKKRAS